MRDKLQNVLWWRHHGWCRGTFWRAIGYCLPVDLAVYCCHI